jgi:hypothetical protein
MSKRSIQRSMKRIPKAEQEAALMRATLHPLSSRLTIAYRPDEKPFLTGMVLPGDVAYQMGCEDTDAAWRSALYNVYQPRWQDFSLAANQLAMRFGEIRLLIEMWQDITTIDKAKLKLAQLGKQLGEAAIGYNQAGARLDNTWTPENKILTLVASVEDEITAIQAGQKTATDLAELFNLKLEGVLTALSTQHVAQDTRIARERLYIGFACNVLERNGYTSIRSQIKQLIRILHQKDEDGNIPPDSDEAQALTRLENEDIEHLDPDGWRRLSQDVSRMKQQVKPFAPTN